VTPEQIWQVVDYNDGLVQKATLEWCKRHGYKKQDWISVGYMGAYKAVETYRTGHGAKLSHWMWLIIHQQLNRAWHREEAQATHQIRGGGRDGARRTYEQKTFLTDPRKVGILHASKGTSSGADQLEDRDYFEDKETNVFEELGADQQFEEDTVTDLDVERAWKVLEPYLLLLDEKDQFILREHYWEGRTFAAIGADIGLSRQGANLRFHNAVKQLQTIWQKEMA
jgi:RNA polymerase sigma factor (sigma-70 family)